MLIDNTSEKATRATNALNPRGYVTAPFSRQNLDSGIPIILFCFLDNMAFKHVKGPALLEYFPKATSVTMTLGQLVEPNGSGRLISATAGATRITGVLQVSVASTDADFASATLVPVILPQEYDEFEVDLTGATFVDTYIGNVCDLNSALLADLSDTGNRQLTVLRQGSSTSKAIVKINGAYSYENAV